MAEGGRTVLVRFADTIPYEPLVLVIVDGNQAWELASGCCALGGGEQAGRQPPVGDGRMR
ncbi:hypothetical protein ABZ904_37410 [Streptomyces sp. NPDC046900]|uniref:hypothetical protein n=1 Tax=Streptomyces sp. NPDC046900 TaxID=3155473 RepID=UPI00340D54C8